MPDIIATVETAAQARACLAREHISAVLLSSHIAFGLPSDEWLALCREVTDSGRQVGLILPEILRSRSAKALDKRWKSHRLSGHTFYLANSYDALGYLDERGIAAKRIIAGDRLYTYSDAARDALASDGIRHFILPYELNERELAGRDLSDGLLTIYGYIPMMLTANCLRHNTTGCDRREGALFLTDRRGSRFPVRNRCEECYNIIYNHLPMSLLPVYERLVRLGAGGYRVSFTIEDEAETTAVLDELETVILGRGEATVTTYGHFKRGVE